jgi:hypothetical protein
MTETKKRIYRQRNLEAPLSVLTPSQVITLNALARYRYLTIKQLIACGVGQNQTHIRNIVLYRLAKRPKGNLVQYQDYFGTNTNFGRLPYVYALTEYGAEKVAELNGLEVSQVRYPVGKIQYVNDYYHREAYIDFCIEADKWASQKEGREVLSLSHYFDKTGAHRKGVPMRSVNRLVASDEIGEIEPDGLFFADTGSKKRALAVEVHNNTDTKRVIQQLAKHTHAINTGVISKRFNHDKASFVLSVSMKPEQTELIIKRFLSVPDFGRFSVLFAFSDIYTIKEKGLSQAFKHADGSPATIFE